MPLYDFACSKCGFIFEEIVRKMDDIPRCAQCGSMQVVKTISRPSPFVWGQGVRWN